MLELGSYWAHYSMWLKLKMPKSKCFMVEPDPMRIKSGKKNFADNFFEGTLLINLYPRIFLKLINL